jgi:hypothetical protein
VFSASSGRSRRTSSDRSSPNRSRQVPGVDRLFVDRVTLCNFRNPVAIRLCLRTSTSACPPPRREPSLTQSSARNSSRALRADCLNRVRPGRRRQVLLEYGSALCGRDTVLRDSGTTAVASGRHVQMPL